jgi:hypothetical protein
MKVGDLVNNVLHDYYGVGIVTGLQRERYKNKVFSVFWINRSPVLSTATGTHWDYDLKVISESR